MSGLPAEFIVLLPVPPQELTAFDIKRSSVWLQVTLGALELANALVGNDAASLEAGCLLGLVPAVLR